ncbi:Glu-tRNA(Gln) amidotransferase subunit GatE [Candidatus Woesearchaeota archaeon]|nr:Glu-tRNA(Gln) amidotransferase subunit GatE [Candidatus Woesearchaeota archaeon]
METLDYHALNFKCGLEIHQQLPDKKLFCNCPCIITDEKPDYTIKRKLKALAGETGQIDVAALHEQAKQKHFVYHCYKNNTCLVEIDEEPPHLVNQDALSTILLVAKMLNAKIVDTIIFMRKTVIDGSNVSGFQRTALVATDGYIETSEGKISIPTICLEEESAKAVERTTEYDVYNLSRLGIPLIEIATGPDIKSPAGAKEAAEKLGMILRSTNKVKRGLGTIRQDVNLSIKNGARVEIKGFQEIKSIPAVIDYEIKRQLELLSKGTKLISEVRKAEENGTTTFLRPMPGAARMYPETDVLLTKVTKEMINSLEVPELIDDKAEKLEKYGISKELAEMLVKKSKAELFESFCQRFKNLKPAYIGELLLPKLLEIKRKYNLDIDLITVQQIELVLKQLDGQLISKEAVEEIFVKFAKKESVDFLKYKTLDSAVIENDIKQIVEQNKDKQFGAIMHLVMAKYRGKADGKLISDLIKKYAQEK